MLPFSWETMLAEFKALIKYQKVVEVEPLPLGIYLKHKECRVTIVFVAESEGVPNPPFVTHVMSVRNDLLILVRRSTSYNEMEAASWNEKAGEAALPTLISRQWSHSGLLCQRNQDQFALCLESTKWGHHCHP